MTDSLGAGTPGSNSPWRRWRTRVTPAAIVCVGLLMSAFGAQAWARTSAGEENRRLANVSEDIAQGVTDQFDRYLDVVR
ncbi:MAG: hypothetical protein K1X95_11605, partial [Acidimicrobiia bacterium]|nr:hypothetical protein [Acidimicrobiia bacterium]